ncbi:DUF4259 domain-containing protein [Mucilaginibacter calamicampi]|uniref:DUF4259 domain-containing protein n=1 Tax=Mucilaginibacter calamicampi TaxID=1302352 RepID=A0ABW2YRK8_9SPHI
MGTWGTGIKENDTFMDVYDEFFDQYNKGNQPADIAKYILNENADNLEVDEDRNNIWFALGLALWETKSLDNETLSKIENIISSGDDIQTWLANDATHIDIKKRTAVLEKFLQKIQSDRPRAKSSKKHKNRTPIFQTGDCLAFKMDNGNYGGAVILATDNNPQTACNLVVTTRLNEVTKPSIRDFEASEVLIRNFANWDDNVDAIWRYPDLYFKDYAAFYEVVGKIAVNVEYDIRNDSGKGYLFKPSFSAAWDMKDTAEMQLASEATKPKSIKTIKLTQLITKRKWWKLW